MNKTAVGLGTVALVVSALLFGSAALKQGDVAAQVMSWVVMKAGQRVWLFHSGTPDVKKEIWVTDAIPVYRQVKAGDRFEKVGKVNVLSYQGKNYARQLLPPRPPAVE